VVLLGTGNPAANPDRSGPSVAIVVNDTPSVVDWGPGVVRRTAAAVRKGVSGLAVSNLKTAFQTHLHSDHTLGYADLILSPWVLGRKEPLEVYGPKGIKAMTDHILAAYKKDIEIRINGKRDRLAGERARDQARHHLQRQERHRESVPHKTRLLAGGFWIQV
jgi:ribonuclease BN (tRNA processing enzyme)